MGNFFIGYMGNRKRERGTQVIGTILNGLAQIYNGLGFWALLQFDTPHEPFNKLENREKL